MKRRIILFLCLVAILAAFTLFSRIPQAVAQEVAPDCGTDPIMLNAYFETGFDLPFKLSEEFAKQYPNVTWDIKQDQFTNLINAAPAVWR